MAKVVVVACLLMANLAAADPPKPPYPLEFEEVPLGMGRPGGYVTVSFGSVTSLYSHVVAGVDFAKSLPRLPHLFARVRTLLGGPFQMPLARETPPSGGRREARLGLEYRDCGAQACWFAGLDGGYYTESLKPCDGQSCIFVDTRDERGLFFGGSAGVDIGSGQGAFRVALDAFGTPNNDVGIGVSFGFTVHLWHDRDALRPARRRTIAFARAERTAAETDCSRVEEVTKRLARDDAGIRDVFVRDPYVARCRQRAKHERIAAEAAARDRAAMRDKAAREAETRAVHERARRRIEADPCLSKRAAMLRMLRDVSDPKEREQIAATVPSCD